MTQWHNSGWQWVALAGVFALGCTGVKTERDARGGAVEKGGSAGAAGGDTAGGGTGGIAGGGTGGIAGASNSGVGGAAGGIAGGGGMAGAAGGVAGAAGGGSSGAGGGEWRCVDPVCEGLAEEACLDQQYCYPEYGEPFLEPGVTRYAGCATSPTLSEDCEMPITASICAHPADAEGECWTVAAPGPDGWVMLSDVTGCGQFPQCGERP